MDYKKIRKKDKEIEINIEKKEDVKITICDFPKILKVKDPPKMRIKKCHEHLPEPYSLLLIASPVKTGKSTLISNLLLNPNFYGKDYFDKVIIISNTIDNCKTSRHLKKAFECHNLYDDNIILNLMRDQEKDGEHNEENKKDNRKSIALIFDDILGSIKRESIANYLATRFRHYNIQLLIYSSQVYKGISNIVRSNCTSFIMGCPYPSTKEKEKIFEDYGDMFGGKDNLSKIYKIATEGKRYNFMYLNLHENPPLAYRNFEKVIAIGDKILEHKNINMDDDDHECNEENENFNDINSDSE